MNWKPIVTALVTLISGLATALGNPIPEDILAQTTDALNQIVGGLAAVVGVYVMVKEWRKPKEPK